MVIEGEFLRVQQELELKNSTFYVKFNLLESVILKFEENSKSRLLCDIQIIKL